MKTVCCECKTVTCEDVENDGLVSHVYLMYRSRGGE